MSRQTNLPQLNRLGESWSNGLVPIRLLSIIIENPTPKRQRPQQEYIELQAKCLNHHEGQNTIALAALRPFSDQETWQGLRRRVKVGEILTVTVAWSFPQGGSFESLHIVTNDDSGFITSGVRFAGNLDKERRIAEYLASFAQEDGEMEATQNDYAVSLQHTSPFPFHNGVPSRSCVKETSATAPTSGDGQRNWFPMYEFPTTYATPGSMTPGVSSGEVARATRQSGRHQERSRTQASKRLIRAYELYAHNIYLSTGDPSEVQKALTLAHSHAASQSQQHQDEASDNDQLYKW